MPLAVDLLYAAARVIGDVADARRLVGSRRDTIGTGFFVTVPSEADPVHRYGYFVTAHHVIEDQNVIEVQATNPFGGGELYEPIGVTDWRQPLEDVDLAVAPFDPYLTEGRTFSALDITRQVLPYVRIPQLGAPIYYIGYLAPLDRMMARTGTIGALEQQGLKHRGGYDYIAHLVDCRSYDGFSGSPCFVVLSYGAMEPWVPDLPMPPDWSPQPLTQTHYFAWLCGMFAAHLEDRHPNEDRVVSRYGVGVMLRSQAIWEALLSDEMRDERRGWDAERAKKQKAGPQLDNVRAGKTSDEYERFEDLARRLVKTPKPDAGVRPESEQS